jgi:oligopeptide transport system substrate-binding protein
MKKISKLIVVMLAIVMMFSLTACSSKDSGKDSGKDNAADTTKDEVKDTEKDDAAETTGNNILNVHFDVEVASMDPQIATDGTSFEVIAAVTEGLYSIDEAGTPIFAMAEAVDKSADGLTYTFTLRDAKWSNGTAVTASDFIYAWRRLVDPAVASEYSFIADIAAIKNAAKITAGEVTVDQLGVSAPDEKTLVVQLDVPVPFFESLMAFPSFLPVNEAFFTAAGDTYGTSPETILSNGPFAITAYEPAATTISLAKSATYWDAAKVSLDGIQYQVIKDSQQAMLSYQNGDLDLATLSGEQVEQFQADPEFNNIMAGYLWYVTPNQKVAGIENVNLRKALALSYDKAAVANNILKDGSIVADFAVPSLLAVGPDGKDFRETADTYLSTDKVKAVEYWNAAKAELGVSELKYVLIVEDTESAINVAQFIQSEIQTTLEGITIELQSMPKKNRVERIQAGEYELCLTRWGPDYADPMTYLDMWTSDSPNNYGLWSNAEYDALIESAKKGELALDLSARWEALKKAEAMVMEEAVILPVYQKGDAVMIKAGVAGVEFHSVGINRIYKNTTKN